MLAPDWLLALGAFAIVPENTGEIPQTSTQLFEPEMHNMFKALAISVHHAKIR